MSRWDFDIVAANTRLLQTIGYLQTEAQAQMICMTTGDFRRAFEAFASKRKPVFEGD